MTEDKSCGHGIAWDCLKIIDHSPAMSSSLGENLCIQLGVIWRTRQPGFAALSGARIWEINEYLFLDHRIVKKMTLDGEMTYAISLFPHLLHRNCFL